MSYEIVTLTLGLAAIAAGWHVSLRIAGSKNAALIARVAQLASDINVLKAARDEENTAARLEGLEAQYRDLRNQANSARPARPWGAVRARAGA